MQSKSDYLIIKGAREHNLKNINLTLPKNSLIVLSGLSGSGKSSLAFDTIFAEGQRRYMESLSSYARQFLGRMEKPDVDFIEGLSPAISIEQKSTNRNPRSTVGTVTEIYDYYRLLWARIGHKFCPKCGKEISEMSIDQIIDIIFSHPEGGKLMIASPVARGKKGEFKKTLEDAVKLGYTRALIDSHVFNIDEQIPSLEKNVKHNISILVDRIKNSSEHRMRLSDAIEKATEMSRGLVEVVYVDEDKSEIYSERNSCPDCGITLAEVEPRLFSFNNPFGACPDCNGLGANKVFDINKIIPDKSLSYNQRAIRTASQNGNYDKARFEAFFRYYGYNLDTPIELLSPLVFDKLCYGTTDKIPYRYNHSSKSGHVDYEETFPGIIPDLERRLKETYSLNIRIWLESFMSFSTCPTCKGLRLRPDALSVKVGGYNIMEATKLSVSKSLDFFSSLTLSKTEEEIARQILKEISSRLNFLKNVGLGYLTLDRAAATLSGGEAQRIRLATQIGSALTGVMYVLDEPSIGLHQRDNEKLIKTLENLRDIGNTVIVVEHDEDTLRAADYLVDIGPGAGELGGEVVAEGSPEDVARCEKSVTGLFLSGKLTIPVPLIRRNGNGKLLTIKGCRKNNLKGIDVSIPLGTMSVITGVSGSGKSTLLNEVLLPAIQDYLAKKKERFDGYESLEGLENIDKVINIDQSPIGRTPRSNPATYVDVFTAIRNLFASLPESKARGFTASRYSFNVEGGRCENCHGDGQLKIEMHFLPDVFVRCDVCDGKRYNKETLTVQYKGKNISDVLEMTVREAYELFNAIPSIRRKLETLMDVGLDYIRLGQSALTLSGGEAQRVKLALELSKIGTGKTLYILDEPTTGLHFADVKKLLETLERLVDQGNTVILIEHNLDVIKSCDYVIDLGPEGGDDGGRVVASGTPEEIAQCEESYTGQFLKRLL
ncbi:MAG TPA: excinuclease ABC subunit UvrA [Candidatus Ornithospirochaeta avicola]|uniref:UvrABC system protein A n=1 Tax=Candidatus Ornithospirochaeta avicola TaxID=2840896 RepID=A0A9D1PSD8_9SPIO|nr:excinuclease ABC subunit UvrA [Candidatus Ornithospirochaeta avicola]